MREVMRYYGKEKLTIHTEKEMYSNYGTNHYFIEEQIPGSFETYHGDPEYYSEILYPLWLLDSSIREAKVSPMIGGEKRARELLYEYFEFMNKMNGLHFKLSQLDNWMGSAKGGAICLTFKDSYDIMIAQPHILNWKALVNANMESRQVTIRDYQVAGELTNISDVVLKRYLNGALTPNQMLGYTPVVAIEIIISHDPKNQRYVVSAAY